ncbi:hypothetical protein C8Q70DRAFT_1026087 [Cubamyces menziesii]|nr:hypothetical protein C8Q70DRAFT_1026087 [Cubamyces menziesii]
MMCHTSVLLRRLLQEYPGHSHYSFDRPGTGRSNVATSVSLWACCRRASTNQCRLLPTMPLSLEERVSFIQGINVRPSAGVTVAADTTAGASDAAVSAGSSVAFVSNIDSQMKADVLNSTLMAQLNASELHNRETDPRSWYNTYLETLMAIGWEVKEFDFTLIQDTDNFLTSDELFLDYVSKYMPTAEFALFRRMLTALQQPQNSKASKLLDDEARTLRMSNWQAGVVSNDGGNPTFKINAFLCSASWTLEHAMFFKLRQGGGEVEITAEHQVMHLDLAKYSQVRELILQQLGNNAQLLIHDIAL